MTAGQSASITLIFGGGTASNQGAEIDLAIDAAGDGLIIDPSGDDLQVSPGQAGYIGTTASVVWPPPSVVLLGTETGGIIGLEGGGEIAVE